MRYSQQIQHSLLEVRKQLLAVQLLTTSLLGELWHHAEHDAGKDLVAVEDAVARPDQHVEIFGEPRTNWSQ